MGSDGESWSSRLSRWGFNWFPAYRGTGGRIVFVHATVEKTLQIRRREPGSAAGDRSPGPGE